MKNEIPTLGIDVKPQFMPPQLAQDYIVFELSKLLIFNPLNLFKLDQIDKSTFILTLIEGKYFKNGCQLKSDHFIFGIERAFLIESIRQKGRPFSVFGIISARRINTRSLEILCDFSDSTLLEAIFSSRVIAPFAIEPSLDDYVTLLDPNFDLTLPGHLSILPTKHSKDVYLTYNGTIESCFRVKFVSSEGRPPSEADVSDIDVFPPSIFEPMAKFGFNPYFSRTLPIFGTLFFDLSSKEWTSTYQKLHNSLEELSIYHFSNGKFGYPEAVFESSLQKEIGILLKSKVLHKNNNKAVSIELSNFHPNQEIITRLFSKADLKINPMFSVYDQDSPLGKQTNADIQLCLISYKIPHWKEALNCLTNDHLELPKADESMASGFGGPNLDDYDNYVAHVANFLIDTGILPFFKFSGNFQAKSTGYELASWLNSVGFMGQRREVTSRL